MIEVVINEYELVSFRKESECQRFVVNKLNEAGIPVRMQFKGLEAGFGNVWCKYDILVDQGVLIRYDDLLTNNIRFVWKEN